MLRPGNAGSNTAADHIALLDAALAQLPDEQRHGYPVLLRADDAGSSKAFLAHSRSSRYSGVHSEFSIGWAVTAREHAGIAALPARAWTPAIDIDGDPRESAAVAELTGALAPGALDDYPPGTRIIVRLERPPARRPTPPDRDPRRLALHLLRHRNPHRPARLARRPAPIPRPSRRPYPVGQRHRPGPVPVASVRDQPSVAGAVMLAVDLLAWAQTILLPDNPALAKAEPKKLRYRLLHVGARLVRGTRKLRLKIDRNWRWAHPLAAALHRLRALPTPAT